MRQSIIPNLGFRISTEVLPWESERIQERISSELLEQVETGLRDWARSDFTNISMPDEWSTHRNGWELTVGNVLMNPMRNLDNEIYKESMERFAKLAPLSVAPWVNSLPGSSKEYALTVLCFLHQLTEGFDAKLTAGQKIRIIQCCTEHASGADIDRWRWLGDELNKAREGVLRRQS